MEQQKNTILIVEDNTVQSLMLEQMVERSDYNVVSIVDRGEKAIATVEELSPSLIIMDIFLNGDMTGIQAMQEIRRKNNDIPVIYVSGNSDPYYASKARKTIFSKFIYKPVSQRRLIDAIDDFLMRSNSSPATNKSQELKNAAWPFSLFA